MNTPFRIPAMRPRLPEIEAYLRYLAQIDSNRRYSNFGPLADELALRLARHYGAERHAICLTANATLALAAVLQQFSADRPGASCLMPSWTFAATAHAACLAGLEPKFVDVDPHAGQLTPEIATQALDPGVAAIVVVSQFGSPVPPAPWEAFCAHHRIGVVIDAAAAFDTVEVSSVPSVVSMHATKPVATGEGGFVLCSDGDVVERARRRTNFGFDPRRVSRSLGLNAKLSEYSAAIGLASLDQWLGLRAALIAKGARYAARLGRLGVELQPGWSEDWISTTLNVRLGDTIGLSAAYISSRLALAGIDARQWWGGGCHTQPAFGRFAAGALPNTEARAGKTLGLPFYVDLDDGDLDEVVMKLEELLDEAVRGKDSEQ